MPSRTDMLLEEWKCSMENARHFNDLLMRLRMLGLPVVITLAAGGIAANAFNASFDVLIWPIPVMTLILALSAIAALGWHTLTKLRKRLVNSLDFSLLELLVWSMFIILLLVPAFSTAHDFLRSPGNYITLKNNYSITPFALIAAVTLLIALYFMDRFYYYKLLIGAVNRSLQLEETLEFQITRMTRDFIPMKYSQNLVTLFYCIPGIILLAIALMLLNTG